MVAIHKLLAKRVDELTEALAKVREGAKEVTEAEKLAEATACAEEMVEYIDEVIGPEEDDGDSEDEEVEFEEESNEDPERYE
jgi:hypothetical protein